MAGVLALAFCREGAAYAEPRARVAPRTIRPGDAFLIEVIGRGADAQPRGSSGGKALAFFATRGGFQALAALPLDAAPGELDTLVGEGQVLTIDVRERPAREVALAVEEEYVDPPPELKERIESDRQRLARIFARSSQALAVKRPFVWPRPRRIIGRFGDRRMFNGAPNSVHQGIDLPGRLGDPVKAANDGLVVLSAELFYSGRTIILDHGAGIYTGYFHLSEHEAQEGDVVRRGARIGKVGATGRTTGPHLHFAVRVDGRYVDPESFMKLRLRPGLDGPANDARALSTRP